MARQQGTITALYMRLSKEDERLGESYSIESQRLILRQAAKEYGFTNLIEYIDDGITGTTFDGRDNLLRLLQDVDDGKISAVLVKDA
jgi:DNA invertase Pin-like site-specific DNA recombinase